MPLLSGLFSRKHKASPLSKRDDLADSLHSTPSDLGSAHSSPGTSSYPKALSNAQSPSHSDSTREFSSRTLYSPAMSSTPSPSHSGKLRLFGRKKSNPASDVSSTSPPINPSNFHTSPRPPQPTRTSTDTDSIETRRLRPPPSRSAIFAAYADPNSALSTRSLPNDPSALSNSATELSPPSSQMPQKRPSLFPWTKPSSPAPSHLNNSTSSSDLAQDLPGSPSSPDTPHSFNLKSFRHLRAPSPTRSNASNVSLTPPVVPRPRGASVNSESSQRISVAAFREAQARRSLAGSPSPSFRTPSPTPALPRDADSARPRPAKFAPSVAHSNQQQRRRSSMALAYTSDSDFSQSESEESEDETMQSKSEIRPSLFDRSSRTSKARAQSELGHDLKVEASVGAENRTRPSRATKSHVGHSFSPNTSTRDTNFSRSEEERKKPEIPPRSQSSLGSYTIGNRQRASVSTSALTPSAAAKRASVLAISNSNQNNHSRSEDEDKLRFRGQLRKSSESPPSVTKLSSKDGTITSASARDSSDSDSEDNAPLASLVVPKRPGSAMSSYSNLHARSTGNVTTRSNSQPPKPLIDINELTGAKRAFSTFESGKNTAGFTEGQTLLSQGRPLVESPVSQSAPLWPPPSDDNLPITRTDPPHQFLTPHGTPAKEIEHYFPKIDAQGPPKKNTLDVASSPESVIEMRRDPITDRLTRVVQKNLLQNGAAHPQQTSVTSKPGFSNPTGLTSEDMRDSSRARSKAPVPSGSPKSSGVALQLVPAEILPEKVPAKADHSPPDEELAQLLGTAVKFISRTGGSSEDYSDSGSDEDGEDEANESNSSVKEQIAPIPIKRRSPPPSFSVTSRPPLPKREHGSPSANVPFAEDKSKTTNNAKLRNTTLMDSPSSMTFPPSNPSHGTSVSTFPKAKYPSALSSSSSSNATSFNLSNRTKSELSPNNIRQRSTTMLTGVPLAAQMAKPSHPPNGRPFTNRRNSPASSTGDSSSGRAPLTPKDSSDFGVSGGRPKSPVQRRSVSFEDDMEDLKPPSRHRFKESANSVSDAGETSNEEDREQKRRERRRGEAKAAIELGKVINGPGPIVEDDDDLPINQAMNPRMSNVNVNPMMRMGNPMPMAMPMGFALPPSSGWSPNIGQPMLSPAQFMISQPSDSNFLAAHQQAMMIAKQAYQMAVAQQAMAAAGDEWERGSAIGGFGGSVYGGSTSSPSMMTPFGMLGMMQGNSWPSSASVFGGGARSMYGASLSPQEGMLSSSRSEYGGPGGRREPNWSSSRSTYGESFGPSMDSYSRKGIKRPGMQTRESGYFPPVPPLPASQNANGRSSPDLKANPRLRTASQPASPGRVARKAPPSSWKPGV